MIRKQPFSLGFVITLDTHKYKLLFPHFFHHAVFAGNLQFKKGVRVNEPLGTQLLRGPLFFCVCNSEATSDNLHIVFVYSLKFCSVLLEKNTTSFAENGGHVVNPHNY